MAPGGSPRQSCRAQARELILRAVAGPNSAALLDIASCIVIDIYKNEVQLSEAQPPGLNYGRQMASESRSEIVRQNDENLVSRSR